MFLKPIYGVSVDCLFPSSVTASVARKGMKKLDLGCHSHQRCQAMYLAGHVGPPLVHAQVCGGEKEGQEEKGRQEEVRLQLAAGSILACWMEDIAMGSTKRICHEAVTLQILYLLFLTPLFNNATVPPIGKHVFHRDSAMHFYLMPSRECGKGSWLSFQGLGRILLKCLRTLPSFAILHQEDFHQMPVDVMGRRLPWSSKKAQPAPVQ